MIALIKKEMLSDRIKEVLSYVPSAIFPAIIFPAILLDPSGLLHFEDNPKIFASIIAIVIGILTNNILATIIAGLSIYWLLIFI